MRDEYYLTDFAGQVPSLRRTSVEFVTAFLELDPVARTSKLIRIGAGLQVIGGGVRIDHIGQRIAELVNIEPRTIPRWRLENIGTLAVAIVELIVESVVVIKPRRGLGGGLGIAVEVGETIGGIGKVLADLVKVVPHVIDCVLGLVRDVGDCVVHGGEHTVLIRAYGRVDNGLEESVPGIGGGGGRRDLAFTVKN